MIYLDYSATTPVDKEVLDTFIKVSEEFIGNPNSLHKLGVDSKKLMEASVKQIKDLLGLKSSEIIFTSSATEANNLALLGIANKYKNRGNHIITTKLEHSSILETVKYLEEIGFEIDYVDILDNGLVDLDDLRNKIKKETILVSICQVNSEVGIKQDLEGIKKVIKEYKNVFLHVDGTQTIGKIDINIDDIDLYSMSAHKIYGLKGIGCLIKKDNLDLIPLIHGGKSQSDYRSGTPSVALIASMAKALRLALSDLDKKYDYVKDLNKKLVKGISIEGIIISSNEYSIPHIVNLSVLGIKSETLLHALEEYDIYISTKTACSKNGEGSITLEAMNKSKEISNSSIRISLSHLTTEKEIERFIEVFKIIVEKLRMK